jgi:hypothetical protein
VNNARFLIQICKGLIRSPRARRTLMFYNVLVLLIMVFLGATILPSWHDHPVLFLVYWFACMWLTMLAVLLALYDMAMVRLEAKRARRQLEEEMLKGAKDNTTDDSNTH